jgi:cobalamin biosynthesis Mg chelatase CobN
MLRPKRMQPFFRRKNYVTAIISLKAVTLNYSAKNTLRTVLKRKNYPFFSVKTMVK